jgi:hypothetical protein
MPTQLHWQWFQPGLRLRIEDLEDWLTLRVRPSYRDGLLVGAQSHLNHRPFLSAKPTY